MTKNPDLGELQTRAAEIAALLKTLSHPNRLTIACQLMDGEQSVSDIERLSGVKQPVLSRDLARLRAAGLVRDRRLSRQVFYSLADDRLERLVTALCDAFAPAQPSAGKSRKPVKRAPARALPRTRATR